MKERCREVLERAYLYIDGEVLSETERVEIKVHIEECAPCLERFGLEREMVFVLKRLQGKTHCPDSLKQRIAQFLDEA
jgi:mycothiol system anti-sigma-R factor